MNFLNKLKGSDNLFSRGMASTVIKMMGALSSYFLSFLIAQKYGAEGNGVFALFMTYTVILSTFFYLGLDLFLVREISSLKSVEKYGEIKKLYNTIWRLYLFPLCGMLGLVIFFLYFFLQNNIYLFIVLGLVLNVIVDLNSAVLQGLKKVELYSFFTQFSKYLITVLLLLFFFTGGNPDMILTSYIISLFVNALFSFLVIAGFFTKIQSRVETTTISFSLSIIFKRSKAFFFSSIIIITLVWVDFVFIDFFLSKDDAGIYSVALKIATIISFSFTAFNAFLAPRISELHTSSNLSELQKILTHNFLITSPMIILPFVGILIFNKELLGIFGNEFQSGTTVLLWLAIGQFINSIFGPVSFLLQMTNHQKLFQNILVITFVFKLLASFIFISLYGLEGVAAASCLGLGLWTILGSYYVTKKVGVYSWFGLKDMKLILVRFLK
jgi:O-antigen/teichoic acid export membrane protein